jgi:hypothetical protein
MRFQRENEFYAALGSLVERGLTLSEIHAAMLTVAEKDMRQVDGSPARIHDLATGWMQWPTFVPIRLAERYGDLAVEHSDDYVLAMIGGAGARGDGRIRDHLLRHDDALREETFWRIFEVEGGGEVSLANVDKFSHEDASWKLSVLTLVADDTLDRARVLRGCLQALGRDFSSYRAGWFSRLYAELAPSAAEAAADQDLLLSLLGSSVTATVSLAARQLTALHRAGLLDGPGFTASAAPALTGGKSVATGVLKILGALGDGPAVTAAAGALQHPHPDVQRAAVRLLETHGRGDLVAADQDLLAPAVAAESAPAATSPSDLPTTAPPLPQPTAVTPWTDDDAVERLAALLEDGADPIELELALAWLARLPDPATALGPLVKRARKRLSSESRYLAHLLVAVAEPDADFLPQQSYAAPFEQVVDGLIVAQGTPVWLPTEEQASPVPLLVARLREVAAILQGRAPRRTLLATPTDTHGGLDPEVYDERHRATESAGLPPLPGDERAARWRVDGATHPEVRIEWLSSTHSYEERGRQRSHTWWRPSIVGSPDRHWSADDPGVIPSGEPFSHIAPVALRALGTLHSRSTLPLAAATIGLLNAAAQEPTPVGEDHVLAALAEHAGSWSPVTAQLVGLGLSASRAEVRAVAAELLVAAVPTRIDVTGLTAGLAACAPACTLSRWASSFADAATISGHGNAVVVDVLTRLLPALDPSDRAMGRLLTVLADESIRGGRPVLDAALRGWLTGFTGSSGAAKTAKALARG